MARIYSSLAGAVSLIALTSAAHAQQTNATAPITAPSAAAGPSTATTTPAPTPTTEGNTTAAPTSAGVAGDIIVTANKRSEALSKVPLSVAAVTGDTLKQQNVTSTQDLSKLIPSLTVAQASQGTEVYTIRGVGFYDTTLAAIPAVSVYVDEVPIPFAAMTTSASLDPERVEVLEGPQGTLFGQNSTGGAINYIAAKPTTTFKAGLSTTVANYGTINADGFISGPITDTLSARVSFKTLNSTNGWQESISRPGDTLGVVNQQQGRLQLDWRPSSRLHMLLSANGFIDKGDTLAPRYAGYGLNIPALAFAVPQLTSAPLTTGGDKRADWDPDKNYDKNDRYYQASLRTEYMLSDHAQITNIASYSHYNHNQLQDLDGLDFENLNLRTTGRIKSYYDEMRLSGDAGPIKYVIGGSYSDSKVLQDDFGEVNIYTTSLAPVYLLGLPQFRNYENYTNENIRSYAGFGGIDYAITDTITLHGGARYTDTRTRFQGCTKGDASLTALGMGTLPPGQCLTLAVTPTGAVSELYRNTLSEHNVSWRGGIDWKPTRDVMIYFNASRGFKAGGFPSIPASAAIQFTPVKQEELTSYELGTKITLFNGAARLTAALFHYDYTNKQIRGRTVDPIFGSLEQLLNIPKSTVNGVEASALLRPVAGLQLTGGVTYIDSKIKNYSNFDVNGNVVDVSGSHFPNAPSFRGNAAAIYDRPVSARLNAFLGGDYLYTSKTRGTLGFTPALNIPSYHLIGLQAGIHDADDKWRISVWAKNITNEFYLIGGNRAGEALITFAGMPRTIGATGTVYFK